MGARPLARRALVQAHAAGVLRPAGALVALAIHTLQLVAHVDAGGRLGQARLLGQGHAALKARLATRGRGEVRHAQASKRLSGRRIALGEARKRGTGDRFAEEVVHHHRAAVDIHPSQACRHRLAPDARPDLPNRVFGRGVGHRGPRVAAQRLLVPVAAAGRLRAAGALVDLDAAGVRCGVGSADAQLVHAAQPEGELLPRGRRPFDHLDPQLSGDAQVTGVAGVAAEALDAAKAACPAARLFASATATAIIIIVIIVNIHLLVARGPPLDIHLGLEQHRLLRLFHRASRCRLARSCRACGPRDGHQQHGQGAQRHDCGCARPRMDDSETGLNAKLRR
mmetsp:Transcript_43628/g.126147  ORF Transcript_43628/g.126147 Transcript_43628/m.126147 type:complete len:338 (-) Transcript_43628:22-1035(-)